MTGRYGAERSERLVVKGRGIKVVGRLWLSEDGAAAYAAANSRDATMRLVVALVSAAGLGLSVAAALFRWLSPAWLIFPGALGLLGLFVMLFRPPRRVSGYLEGAENDQIVVLRGVHPDFVAAADALCVEAAGRGGMRRPARRAKGRDLTHAPAGYLEELEDLDDGPVDVHGQRVDKDLDARRFGPADGLRLE